MRIGTWNLAGRWSDDHRALLEGASCDVWLLTEVPAALVLDGGALARSEVMRRTKARAWAAIWSAAPSDELSSPHPAAALVQLGDLRICSCVLPWRGARATWPAEDEGSNLAGLTTAALDRLRASIVDRNHPVIWGGDWNHAMTGREWAGSMGGRAAIASLLEDAGLTVATAGAPHRIEDILSIDHIAVPSDWTIASCRRIRAALGDRRLSDHDAYVVEAAP